MTPIPEHAKMAVFHATTDPNDKPVTEVEQLHRRLDQAREEAIERARVYDEQNAFFQSRTSALTARLTVLERELRERDRAIDDALLSMREPMTLRDAQAARDYLTHSVVEWKKASARAALEAR